MNTTGYMCKWDGNISIMEYDIAGRKIKSQKIIASQQATLDVSDIALGVYKIECKHKGQREIQTFIKN